MVGSLDNAVSVGDTTQSRRAVSVIAALCVLLYVNWFFAIARFQPNVMFMDQWDYLLPLFNGQGWWWRFVQQQGPVREGLGLVVTGWILEATAWDVRYDSLWIATALLIATVLALRVKWKMAGSLTLRDSWIALFGLSLGHFETIVSVPNASHSVVPLALILLAANFWLSSRPSTRYLGAAATAFALTFTGFGLFASGVIAVLLAARVIRHALDRHYRVMALGLIAIVVIVAGWTRFSRDYVFLPAVEGFRFPWTPWTDYVHFVVLMLNLPTARVGAEVRHYLLGIGLGLVVVFSVVGIARLWFRHRPSLNDDVLMLLMGSGLLFITATAIGRVSLGILGGTMSRYLPLMFPTWLAVYLAAITSYKRSRLAASVCVWLLVVLPYTAMVRRPLAEWPGTLGAMNGQVEAMAFFGMSKIAWARAYLATGSWKAAQCAVRQVIYPNPEVSRFDDKLRFLRRHELSFFAGRVDESEYLPWLASDDFSDVNCPSSDSNLHVCR